MIFNNRKVSWLRLGQTLSLAAIVLGVQGCSLQSGSAKIAQGFSAVGASLQSLEPDVHSKQLTEDEYLLWQQSYHSFKSYESAHFRRVSKELCPIGYVPLSRQAVKQGRFAVSDATCNGGCEYTLQWHIRCQDVPEESFSLFGKT